MRSGTSEHGLVLSDVVGDRQRLASGEFLHPIIGPGKKAVPAIDGDRGDVLDEVRREPPSLEVLLKGFDVDRDVGDRSAHDSRENLDDLILTEFLRAKERIGLSRVFSGVAQDGRDHSSLIFPGDRSVATVAERQRQDVLFPNRPRLIHQPFREEGGSQMGHGDARPIQQTLGDPMVLRGMTLRVPAGGDLRHIHDRPDSLLLRRLGKKRCRLEDAGHLNWIDEIGGLHSFQRPVNGLEIREVALNNLHALSSELVRPLVDFVDQRADADVALQQLENGAFRRLRPWRP